MSSPARHAAATGTASSRPAPPATSAPRSAALAPARPPRQSTGQPRWLPLLSRIVAAIAGGYALAALTSAAAVALPLPPAEAITTGMLLSFAVHATVVIGVFAARSARRAWAGLLLAALPLLLLTWPIWRGPTG